nr:hypothetical protein [uncultured Ralstonia sp.]
MTDCRRKRAYQCADARGNEHVLARHDFKQIRIDRCTYCHAQTQLFGNLAGEAAAGQLSLFAFIEQQDDLAGGRAGRL